jgi:LmbE family N-acetylglucosaminyl deacetylase
MNGGLMVITAHPDDEVLVAGGTLAACAELGLSTSVVCLTRGENGPIAHRGLATRQTLPAVRAQELREAGAALGVGLVKCYRRQDGGLRWSNRSAIAGQLARIIDELQPDVVATFGEDGLYYHSDHIATYELARMATRQAAHPAALYRSVWSAAEMRRLAGELRRRNLPTGLWGLELEDLGVEAEDREGEVVVDVVPFVGQKLQALYCHRTQLEPGHALLSLPDDLAERFLGHERFAPVQARAGATRCFFDRVTHMAAKMAHG